MRSEIAIKTPMPRQATESTLAPRGVERRPKRQLLFGSRFGPGPPPGPLGWWADRASLPAPTRRAGRAAKKASREHVPGVRHRLGKSLLSHKKRGHGTLRAA